MDKRGIVTVQPADGKKEAQSDHSPVHAGRGRGRDGGRGGAQDRQRQTDGETYVAPPILRVPLLFSFCQKNSARRMLPGIETKTWQTKK